MCSGAILEISSDLVVPVTVDASRVFIWGQACDDDGARPIPLVSP